MGNAGKTILVLEDQPLIAVDIEDVLMEAGFDNISVISSCADAEKWLQSNEPDLAILDVHLRDGVCADVAKILTANNVPFIVHSALHTHFAGDGSVFEKGRWVSKTGLPDRLMLAVSETLSAA